MLCWANKGQIPSSDFLSKFKGSSFKFQRATNPDINEKISSPKGSDLEGTYPALGMKTQNAGRSTGSFADDNSLVRRGCPEKGPLPAPTDLCMKKINK